jgi:hypothetical protein
MKAFPSYEWNESCKQMLAVGGMDLRDYFAIHANDYDIYKHQVSESGLKKERTRAEARYKFADEMMEARKK